MLHCRIRLIVGLVVWLFAVVGYAAPKPEVAGYVTRVRGEVVSEAATGRQTLALGRALYLGDRIMTGVDARLEARMRDGMVVTLGEKTEFVIQQVAGVTPDKNNSVFELAKGVFRSATAQTEEKAQPREPCRVETPVATIGIRGTELWGGFNLLDAGVRTLDVVMLEGKGVYVESNGQRVELNQAGAGTTVQGFYPHPALSLGEEMANRNTATPTPSKIWKEKKLQAAQRTVAW
ncbi:MAG: FecR family protein [Candidatus Contendobacter sp.]|nr:FecR family protein [Candidatus Contendobacter sp.]MDS4057874.1 FecR family protein [Candidatus Contendobacter sp.]